MVSVKYRLLSILITFNIFTSLQVFAQHAASTHPNVIILYADDLGYGDLSCYGATQISTPNIDKLAAEGIRFTNAHATASTCTPSRFSILTGEYAFRNKQAHILPGNAPLLIPTDKATLGTVFQKAGYNTACIGKWHVGLGPQEGLSWNKEIKPGPNEVGFDYSFIFPATADRVPTVYIQNHHVVALDSTDPIDVSYLHKVGSDPTGKEHPELLKMKSSPGQGHDGTIVNGIGRIGWMSGGKRSRWVDEELEDDFTSQAEEYIERNANHPFFLYFALSDIHVPRMPDTRFKGKSILGYRGDAILQMDYVVGRIMNTLKELGLNDNTLVIFTSDNGPVVDDGYQDDAVKDSHGHKPAGPLRGGKYSVFEGGTRIPFIVHYPPVIKPDTSSALISQVDLVSSFASLVNQKLDAKDAPDSYNILNSLLGKSHQGRNIYIEQNNNGVLAIIKDNWKYIEPADGPALFKEVNIESGLDKKPQLYNLAADIAEKNNLADRYPEKVKELAAELQKIKSSKGTRQQK